MSKLAGLSEMANKFREAQKRKAEMDAKQKAALAARQAYELKQKVALSNVTTNNAVIKPATTIPTGAPTLLPITPVTQTSRPVPISTIPTGAPTFVAITPVSKPVPISTPTTTTPTTAPLVASLLNSRSGPIMYVPPPPINKTPTQTPAPLSTTTLPNTSPVYTTTTTKDTSAVPLELPFAISAMLMLPIIAPIVVVGAVMYMIAK